MNRRSLLTCTAAVAVGGVAMTAIPSRVATYATPLDAQADRLFQRWLVDRAAVEAAPDHLSDAAYDVADATEAEIIGLAPSITRSAIVALFGIFYGTADHSVTFQEVAIQGGKNGAWCDEDCKMACRILPGLRPHLTGMVSTVVDDLVDHPDRPLSESALLSSREV